MYKFEPVLAGAVALASLLVLNACSNDEAGERTTNGPSAAAPSAELAADPAPVATQEPLPQQNPATPTSTATEAAGSTEEAILTANPDVASTQNESGDGAPSANTRPTQHIITGVVTQWRPMVLFAQPGDQIVFKQMAGHDTASIDGMTPERGETWQSKLGEEGYSITLNTPGVYVYKCTPHVSLGMIGAIVIGETPPSNLAELEAHPQNKGMVGRAIRKLKQALDAQSGG